MNVHLNSGDFPASVYVRELDWKASWPPPSGKSSASQGRSLSLIDCLIQSRITISCGPQVFRLGLAGMVGARKNLKNFRELLYS